MNIEEAKVMVMEDFEKRIAALEEKLEELDDLGHAFEFGIEERLKIFSQRIAALERQVSGLETGRLK